MPSTKNIFRVPIFLEADTPSELTQICLKNNTVNDKMYDYNVLYNGKKYLAWFITGAEDYTFPTGGIVNGPSK